MFKQWNERSSMVLTEELSVHKGSNSLGQDSCYIEKQTDMHEDEQKCRRSHKQQNYINIKDGC